MYSQIPYTVEDFLNKCYTGERISHRGGKEAYISCFYCGCSARKKKCSVVLYGDKAHLYSCLGCGRKTNTRQIIRDLYNESADKFMLGDDYKEIRKAFVKPQEPKIKVTDLAPLEKRDKVNKTLLSLLFLEKEDIKGSGNKLQRKTLIERGFDYSDLQYLGYKTVNVQSEDEIIKLSKTVQAQCGTILGVCGTYKEKGIEKFNFIKKYPQVLIPYRNRNRRIQGFQVSPRYIPIDKETGLPRKKFPKYFWFSSSDKEEGCGCGNFVHYATDFYVDFVRNEERAVIKDAIYITEGALKGDLAHKYSKLPFLCVAGVNNCSGLKDELSSYIGRVKHVICAFDMDYLDNPDVASATERLKETIQSLGFEYHRLLWDENYKGIDDFMVSCNGKYSFSFKSEDHEEVVCSAM